MKLRDSSRTGYLRRLILEEIHLATLLPVFYPTTAKEAIYTRCSVLIDGSVNVRELIKSLDGTFLPRPKTLNGLILEYLEDIPQANISLRPRRLPIEIS